MSNIISANIRCLRQDLPEHVRLIAVSKYQTVNDIRLAYKAGIRDFGESRLQEGLEKQALLRDLPDIRWHFIGHLQKNKAKKAIANFDWLHTVDSLALAQKLNRYALELGCYPHCCLQIKPLPDPNKYGWEIPQLMEELKQLSDCEHLKIVGLMTILPLNLSPQEILGAFQTVADLKDTLNQDSNFTFKLSELSMGMSGDYLSAIQTGATIVRLGRAVFGSTSTPLSLS